MKQVLIITAGGSSQRFGRNKLIEKVNGKEVILYTLDAFAHLNFSEIIITVSEELKSALGEIISNKSIKLVMGGKTRQESVYNGLNAIETTPDLVLIHDGARPLVDKTTIDNCVKKASESGAAIAAVPAIDTIKTVAPDGKILDTPDRKQLWAVQTPQVFDYKTILEAHKRLEGASYTDDAGLLEALNIPVYTAMGSYRNIKITNPDDIALMKFYLSQK